MTRIRDIERLSKSLGRIKELDAACLQVEKMAQACADGANGFEIRIQQQRAMRPRMDALSVSPITLMFGGGISFGTDAEPEEKPSPTLDMPISDHLILCVLDVLWRQMDAERRELMAEIEA